MYNGRESRSQDTHKISAGRLPSSCPPSRRFPRIRFLPRQFLPRIYAPTGALLFFPFFFRRSSFLFVRPSGAANQRPFSHLFLNPHLSQPIPPIPARFCFRLQVVASVLILRTYTNGAELSMSGRLSSQSRAINTTSLAAALNSTARHIFCRSKKECCCMFHVIYCVACFLSLYLLISFGINAMCAVTHLFVYRTT